MGLEAVLGVIVVASVMGIWGGAAVSKMIEREQGVEAAEGYNTRILMGIVGFVLLALVGSLLITLLDPSRFEVARVGFLIFRMFIIGGIGGYFLYIIWNRRRLAAQELLLDAGRNKPSIYSIPALLGGYLLLDLTFQLIRAFLNNDLNLEWNPGLLLSLLLITAFFIGLGMSIFYRIYFIKEGILLFRATPIKWEHIRDYSWGVRNKNEVSLLLKGGKRVKFTIGKEHKEEVESILQAHVKRPEEILRTQINKGVVQG